MKYKKTTLALIVALVGIVLMLGTAETAMLFMTGKKINLNTAKQSEFSAKAAVEGEIFYPVDYFATYEETQTKYGIPVSKTETYYYLIASFDEKTAVDYLENGVEFDEFYVVYSTSNKNQIKALNDLVTKWNRWYDDYENGIMDPYPESIELKGRLVAQPDDADYIQYRDEFLALGGFDQSEVAELRIADSKVTVASPIMFFIGIGLIVLGIMLFLRFRREAQEAAEFSSFDNTPDSTPDTDAGTALSAPAQQTMNDDLGSSVDEMRQLRAKLNSGEITQEEYDQQIKDMLGM